MDADDLHCLTVLRETDRDRYLACLLAPAEKRGALAALYAFNAEIARIRDVVHEPLPGEIRMQWWRDVLEGASAGDAAANPLASALLRCIEAHRLPVPVLVDLIDARIFDLYDDPMDSVNSLEGYAGETASALVQLACLIVDPPSAAAAAQAAGHAGVAQTVAGLLLLAPIQRRRGQVYVPAELLAATGTDAAAFLAGSDRAANGRVVSALVGLGRDHWRRARQAGGVTRANVAAFLSASLAPRIFDGADRAGAATLERSIQPAQWRRQWWLWKTLRRGRL
ncbi:phytoene/squalene synthase family protein [Rhizobium sp. TRM95111]|uniref:phytoene/squalene synthase family protein n=1 Tax=Rhizobium alarense TaxID=2846851 RepID=UPI001F1AAF43|nr:phytoene/squalene synthase family protein [Rhizobium alarense]MCF3642114.1 phytoene/squalene synthase family protein [Rhizobium alarense]